MMHDKHTGAITGKCILTLYKCFKNLTENIVYYNTLSNDIYIYIYIILFITYIHILTQATRGLGLHARYLVQGRKLNYIENMDVITIIYIYIHTVHYTEQSFIAFNIQSVHLQ